MLGKHVEGNISRENINEWLLLSSAIVSAPHSPVYTQSAENFSDSE